ncbi:MAG: hypothetical protein IT292_12095 [Deltaproteobacteria bacterium]|nr:hypothetical protein [Deltaproteobacteria bacterium]
MNKSLFIDDIVGTYQTVIKNLDSMFKEEQGLSGCAIMPNGEIGLILDVRSLAQLARTNYVRETVLPSLADKDLTFNKVAQLPIA